MRGHVRKRGTKWAVVVDVGTTGRRRQRWHSGFDTKRAATAALTEILGRLQKGDYVEPSKVSFGAFLAEYLDAARATLRPGTWEGYRMNVAVYIVPAIGTIPLQAVTPSMLTGLVHGPSTGRASEP